MTLLDEPLLTTQLSRSDFRPSRGTYIHALSTEARSQLDPGWVATVPAGLQFVQVFENEDETITFVADGDLRTTCGLRNLAELVATLDSMARPLYLDFTGFTHRAWAPLVRAGLIAKIDELVLIYVEPASYTRSASPSPGNIFDLSEIGSGIAPLPGFASLSGQIRGSSRCFVPMLGFEGARLGLLLTEVEPEEGRVIPIVGIPGFRLEYPFQAFLGNRDHFDSNFLHRKVRYAKANCPFDAFQTLQRIASDYPNDSLQIAPIGTKPHSLAAVLFALARPQRVELIYDNPKRKNKRTMGEAQVCLYDVGCFTSSDLFKGEGRYA